MKLRFLLVWVLPYFCLPPFATAQTTPESVRPLLAQKIQSAAVTAFQVQRFLLRRVPKLPAVPATGAQWTTEEARLRKHFLNDIAFHGWPRAWIKSPPVFQPMGALVTDGSYRLLKFRYEIVPGFWSTALLYEPREIRGKVPAVLNLDGHFRLGKADEWVQKLCINLAKRGILVLNLEWIGFGELWTPQDSHDYGADLDLVGTNVLGLFYLAMRRGMDYLANLPEVDTTRLGVTGLSGGGWQTIVLGALDPRVKSAVEVAGFESLTSGALNPHGMREVEIDAPDFCQGKDYSYLVAMRAPRPTLLMYNAKDQVYRSGIVKPYIYDDIKPFFRLYEKPDALAWHENLHPGTHNYQIDNRQHAYAFFTRYFHMPVTKKEIPSDAEIKSYKELEVGLPADNLTVLRLARELASKIERAPIPAEPAAREQWVSAEKAKLKSVVRYQPVVVENAWRIGYTKAMGVETLAYRLDFNNGLSASGVWIKPVSVPATAPATIVLNDNGRKAAVDVVSDRVNRGEQVLALDLIFNGEMRPQNPDPVDYEPLVDATGDRTLGLEAAQLIGAANWLRRVSNRDYIRLETTGIRSQVVALVATDIDPTAFSKIVTHDGMRSLAYLLDAPVPFRKAPELFCLDLYKYFDLDRFIAMASPTKVRQTHFVEPVAAPERARKCPCLGHVPDNVESPRQ
ncbi:MAG: acetylxylan esterase [Acidobacteria bacterium]|nr:acetylxylan esterase [Acidobacteriota bacterium]